MATTPSDRDPFTGLTDRERIATIELRMGFLLGRLVTKEALEASDVVECMALGVKGPT